MYKQSTPHIAQNS